MKKILLLCFSFAFAANILAQDRVITGRVTSVQDGSTLPGVNVVLKGTTNGAVTDTDGQYRISVPGTGGILIFSFIGFATVEIDPGDKTTVDVQLELDATQLNEIVVIGYGTTTKEAFVGSAKSISSANIETKSYTNVAQAMAGEVAGVNVINTSGQPGNISTVRIRGFGSTGSDRDPLYVVDGVPLTDAASLNSINPADITSFTILKDATATTIYGARGANGVVVITTKGGSKDKSSSIDVEYKTGVNYSGLPRYDVIRSPERYTELTWEGMKNRGFSAGELNPAAYANDRLFTTGGIGQKYNMWNVADGGELIDPATGKVRAGVTRKYNPENWQDYGFQRSTRNEANIRISGGGDKSTHYLSLGYLDDMGYITNSDFKRYSVRTNLTHTVTKWLQANINLGLTSSDQNTNGQSNDSGSIFWFTDNLPSIFPLYLRDSNGDKIADPYYGGYTYDYGVGRGFGALTNSISDAHIQVNNTKRNELVGNVNLKVDFTSYLSFEVKYGLQFSRSNFTNLESPFYGGSAQAGGSLYRELNQYSTQNFQQLLRFNKNFGDHNFDALLAHESSDYTRKLDGASKRKSVDPFIDDFNNFIINTNQPFGYTEGWALESYFGQLNYDFKEKYYFSGSMRRDGTSRFVDNKWGTFGSVGVSWRINRESFFSAVPSNIVSGLKLKGSYGVTGNQSSVGYYPGYNTFDISNLNDGISLTPRDNGVRSLTWEGATMWQGGLEFELLNRRIEGSVDYYYKSTGNLIFDRRVGPSLGIAIIKVNDGALVNKGLEFDLTGHILNSGDFRLDLSVNGAFNTNLIKTMPIDPATSKPKILDTSPAPYAYSEGHSIYDYYMPQWAGVDAADGKAMWYQYYDDLNSNGVVDAGEGIADMVQYKAGLTDASTLNLKKTITKTYSSATNDYVGKSAIPKLRGAFRITAKYKGFDLSSQFLYGLGGYSYDATYAGLMNNVTAGNNNWHKDIEKRWQEAGDITDVPRLSEGLDTNVASRSTRFLVKSNFLSLNNIKLGYTIPANLLSKIFVKGASVWVSGDNLFFKSARAGFNPTTSQTGGTSTYNYAPLTTITGGVRVTF